MKTIDILILDITLVGGIERVASILANEFHKKNKVRIISFFKTNQNIFYEINDSIEIVYLSETKFNLEISIYKIIDLCKLVKMIRQYLKSTYSDVIISLFTNINIISALFLKEIDGIFIATEHAQYYSHNWIVRVLRKHLYPKLSQIVVLNSTDYKIFNEFMKGKVSLIPNPLTFTSLEYSLLEEKNIFSAGRLETVKGFDMLIKAFKEVVCIYPDWKLIITGDGKERKRLQQLIINLELTRNVELRHFDKDIKNMFLNSSIYCLSSREECFPMILLEAMTFGLPVVSFNVPSGPKDIISDSFDGFLIPPFDILGYANKIISLIQSSDLRKVIGSNAKNNISRYSINNIMKLWEDLLKSYDKKY